MRLTQNHPLLYLIVVGGKTIRDLNLGLPSYTESCDLFLNLSLFTCNLEVICISIIRLIRRRMKWKCAPKIPACNISVEMVAGITSMALVWNVPHRVHLDWTRSFAGVTILRSSRNCRPQELGRGSRACHWSHLPLGPFLSFPFSDFWLLGGEQSLPSAPASMMFCLSK